MEQVFLSLEEKNNIEIDLKFLESMKTDRKATYGSLDTASIKRNEKRQRKTSKEISEQSSSSVLQSHAYIVHIFKVFNCFDKIKL